MADGFRAGAAEPPVDAEPGGALAGAVGRVATATPPTTTPAVTAPAPAPIRKCRRVTRVCTRSGASVCEPAPSAGPVAGPVSSATGNLRLVCWEQVPARSGDTLPFPSFGRQSD